MTRRQHLARRVAGLVIVATFLPVLVLLLVEVRPDRARWVAWYSLPRPVPVPAPPVPGPEVPSPC